MNDLSPGITNEVMSRRSFLAGSAAMVGGVALTAVGLTVPTSFAFAAPELGPNDVVITANIYVHNDYTPIEGTAYLTNPGLPPRDKPITPVTDNAIYNTSTHILTVPIVNTVFALLSIGHNGAPLPVSVVSTSTGAWPHRPPFIHPGKNERIVSAKFNLSGCAPGPLDVEFNDCTEYASFAVYAGQKDWPIHLSVNVPE